MTIPLRKQFKIYQKHPNLVYLDSASSSLTPDSVIQAMNGYYFDYRANIHRGLYDSSQKATQMYESSRSRVASFIGAQPDEIVFTSGTTHSLNHLASSLSNTITDSDNIVISIMEHHANLVPWQQVAQSTGCELRYIDVADYELSGYDSVIDQNTKIVSVTGISNTLGTINPIREIVQKTHEVGALCIIDAAQMVAHVPIDVKDLDCDFLVFSGHKMYGPTGTGVLYGKKEKLEELKPLFYGGAMIEQVTKQLSTFQSAPAKHEAGVPNIAGVIGLGAAIDFLKEMGWEKISAHERKLTSYLLEKLGGVTKIIGTNNLEKRIGVVSFRIPDIHSHDVAEILNRHDIAVRSGHHCTIPLMNALDISGTLRASVGVYNTKEDIDALLKGIEDVKRVFEV